MKYSKEFDIDKSKLCKDNALDKGAFTPAVGKCLSFSYCQLLFYTQFSFPDLRNLCFWNKFSISNALSFKILGLNNHFLIKIFRN